MADNFSSYERFTALPANIAEYGAPVEIFKPVRKPDPNPQLSPLANPLLSSRRLALKARSSDPLRLAHPEEPDEDPYDGPGLALTVTRRVISKLEAKVFGELKQFIEQAGANGVQLDAQVQKRLLNSLELVKALLNYMKPFYKMTDTLYAKLISAQRG